MSDTIAIEVSRDNGITWTAEIVNRRSPAGFFVNRDGVYHDSIGGYPYRRPESAEAA